MVSIHWKFSPICLWEHSCCIWKLGHLWICGEKDDYGLVVRIIQKASEKDISVADFIRSYLQKLKIPGYSTFHLWDGSLEIGFNWLLEHWLSKATSKFEEKDRSPLHNSEIGPDCFFIGWDIGWDAWHLGTHGTTIPHRLCNKSDWQETYSSASMVLWPESFRHYPISRWALVCWQWRSSRHKSIQNNA